MADAEEVLRKLESLPLQYELTPWEDAVVTEAAALIRTQREEIEALKHDIERHIAIASAALRDSDKGNGNG